MAHVILAPSVLAALAAAAPLAAPLAWAWLDVRKQKRPRGC